MFHPGASEERREEVRRCLSVAKNRFRVPQDNADTFRVLSEEDVIPEALAAHLEEMARFRNPLVHRCGTVDDKRAHTIMREELGDVNRFLEALGDWLETGPTP